MTRRVDRRGSLTPNGSPSPTLRVAIDEWVVVSSATTFARGTMLKTPWPPRSRFHQVAVVAREYRSGVTHHETAGGEIGA